MLDFKKITNFSKKSNMFLKIIVNKKIPIISDLARIYLNFKTKYRDFRYPR